MAGSFKVLYSHFRTVRHASKEEQLEHGALVTTSQPQGASFGVRALKSGIEVEGVWISQANSSTHSASKPELPREPARLKAKPGIDLTLAPNTQDLTTTRVHPAIRDRSPERGRAKHDYVPYMLRTTQPRQALDELDAVYRTPRWYREESHSSLDISDIIARPPSIPPRSPKRNDKPSALQSADLTMLDRHRCAQAAETGQLTARAKKHNLTLDTAAARRAQSEKPTSRKTIPAESQTDFIPSSSRAPLKKNKLRSKPKELVVPPRSTSLPDVVPFKQFIASTGPPSPQSSFNEIEQEEISKLLDYAYGNDLDKRSGPHELDDTSPQRETAQMSDPGHNSRQTSSERGTVSRGNTHRHSIDTAQKSSQEDSPRRLSFEKSGTRRDQVLRGHDSGFEILRPGTLKDSVRPEGRQQNGPPISLHNYARPRDESRGRKLQKKRRGSVNSQTSTRSTSTGGRRLSWSSLVSRFTGNDS